MNSDNYDKENKADLTIWNDMLREGAEGKYLPDRHWSQGKKLPQ